MKIPNISFCRCAAASLPFVGFLIGNFLDQMETERMSRFYGKSALYGPPPPPPPCPVPVVYELNEDGQLQFENQLLVPEHTVQESPTDD